MVLTRGIRRVQVNTWVLLGVALAWLAVNFRWIALYRDGQVFDIDEAGYFGMALNNHGAALRDGVTGWVEAVEAPGIQAPLLPALTSLHFFATGTGTVAAFVVPLLAGVALILLTHAVANRVAGRPFAWIATALIATAPGVIFEARAYHFALPAAVMTTAAIYFLVRSEGLSKPKFVVLFGIFVGLMPLSRTMAVAFVPGLVLAALIQAAVPHDRMKRLKWFALAAVVGAGVAAIWLVPNGVRVFQYLTGFGYGKQSVEFGEQAGVFNPGAWVQRLKLLIFDHGLPHTVLLCAGLVAAIVVAVAKVRTGPVKETLRSMVASPLFPSALLVAEGGVAVLTSKNAGTAFFLPLIPSMAILALWGLYRAHRSLRRALPFAVAVVGLVASVPLVDLRLPTAHVWSVDLPVLGTSKITDGRGSPQIYVDPGGRVTEPVSVETVREWKAVAEWAAGQVEENHALGGATAFGFRDRLFNTNTLQLEMLRRYGYGVALPQVSPTEDGNTEPDYRAWLTSRRNSNSGDASKTCLLFTATGTINEFEPKVDPPSMVSAATASGFTPVTTRPLPNGRLVTLWKRPQPACMAS
ncbi:glycosyltransferase family 39 protein [Amycolatopsis sp. BJA-103]|uniref:ArnT family glycosyltransferase n=1 Tax=Amycolatopsis sp. BJA-103 TaxID=1911175 RepID=UPI001E57B377|nr:glycosyltransferase family 39 protein [Amycolatopsis sp. BJA-103]